MGGNPPFSLERWTMEKPVMAKAKTQKIDEWEIENGLSTLTRAEEIRNNPSLMKAIKKKASEQQKALQKVAKTKPKKGKK